MRSFDFSPLFRSTVGFDRLFDLLDSVPQYDTAQTYPPYNIERTDETHYRITLAVAGFGEKELNVEVREGVLTVQGKREESAEGKSYEAVAHVLRVSVGTIHAALRRLQESSSAEAREAP